jgi:hypothetical protein
MAFCNFCNKIFTSWDDVLRHERLSPDCQKKDDQNLYAVLERLRQERRAKDRAKKARQNWCRTNSVAAEEPSSVPASFDTALGNDEGGTPFEIPESDPPFEILESNTDEPDAVPPQSAPTPAADRTSAPNAETGRARWRDPSSSGDGGATYGTGKTKFEEIRDEEILKGAEVLGPFKDEAEWELAKWLIKHVGHTAADEFLKLSIVSSLNRG